MTIREACAVLGKGETWMRERIADGTLSASRVGRSVILSREQVMALVPGKVTEAAE
jgi:excisionase family DNA binding protein